MEVSGAKRVAEVDLPLFFWGGFEGSDDFGGFF